MSIIKKFEGRDSIDLMALLHVLLKKLHFIVLWMVLCAIAAYAAGFFWVTPTYKASITLYVHNSTRTDSTGITSADLYASARLVDTYAAIIVSETMTEAVLEEAQSDLSIRSLQRSISVSSVNETEVFKISVVHTDPNTAARLANAIATVAPERIAAIVEGSTVKVIDLAKVPKSINSPNYTRFVQIGALAGLLLSVGFFSIRALLDISIRHEEDLQQWEYPLLATLPNLEDAENKRNNGYRYGYGKGNNRGRQMQ